MSADEPVWVRLIFETDKDRADGLSDALSEVGASAVSLEDCEDEPVLEPGPGEMPLWTRTRVIALFQADVVMEGVVSELAALFTPLPPHKVEPLENQDWVRVWMDRFEPMRFGKNLWIVPHHHEPPEPEAVNLRLDPGLAFGTGTHPTTALCLEWLDGIGCEGKQVIDYGCGSGVLAIAALLLGADSVVGIDIDEQAWIATMDNAKVNGVDDRVSVGGSDMPLEPADMVLANILAGPLGELAPHLAELTKPGGRLVLSGILEEQAETVMQRYQIWFELDPPKVMEDWVRITGIRTS